MICRREALLSRVSLEGNFVNGRFIEYCLDTRPTSWLCIEWYPCSWTEETMNDGLICHDIHDNNMTRNDFVQSSVLPNTHSPHKSLDSILIQPLHLFLLHQPPLQTTSQHPLLLGYPHFLQPIIFPIPIHRPPIPSLLFFHSDQTLLIT